MHMSEDGVYDPEDLQCFQDAVDAFLHLLRKCNPSSHIVWVYGMLGYELTLAITDAVNAYQKQTGDHNVAFCSFLTLPMKRSVPEAIRVLNLMPGQHRLS